MKINNYKDLTIWQKSIDLVEACYRLTKDIPNHEQYGITSQLRRAAVSVPANIAEGHNRLYKKEYLYHLSVCLGSLAEVETFLYICVRLHYFEEKDIQLLLNTSNEIGKMITGIRKALKASSTDPLIPGT